jgi:hypothetical protein
LTEVVVPFLAEIKAEFPPDQFSFNPEIDLQDRQFVGVSFKVGNGPMVAISAAFGNIVIAQSGGSGSAKGIEFIYDRDAQPFISSSRDLTKEKVATHRGSDRQLLKRSNGCNHQAAVGSREMKVACVIDTAVPFGPLTMSTCALGLLG